MDLSALPKGITALLPMGKRPGRPSMVNNPDTINAVAAARAQGMGRRRAGRVAGVSERTVYRIEEQHQEQCKRVRQRIERIAFAKVLAGADSAFEARMTDAATVDSRTGPQSLQVCLEAVGMGRKGSMTVNGDVSVQALVLSESGMHSNADPQRLAELAQRLGLSGQ